MPDALHIFTGKVGPVPRFFKDESVARGWYHVNCLSVGPQQPCVVALTEAGIPGGDRLDPTCSGDWYGPGVWIAGPKPGTASVISVERRFAPSYRSISPLGERTAIYSQKSVRMGLPVPNDQAWHPVVTNVIGQIGVTVKVVGGTVWIGTHMASNQPFPPDPATMAAGGTGAVPLSPSDGFVFLEGNPGLYAGTFEPGVVLYVLKETRGALFVSDPSL